MLSNQLAVFLRLLLQIQMILKKKGNKKKGTKAKHQGEVKKQTWLRCSAFSYQKQFPLQGGSSK